MVSHEYTKEIEKARRLLRCLIADNKCAPLMIHLAWNQAATYDAKTRTGGPNGSIQIDNETKRSENDVLKTVIGYCEQVKGRVPDITYADLYQLAGVVAVEVSGGPSIEFIPGRKDSTHPSPQGQLPDPEKDASHLKEAFYRMGLSDQDIVALLGIQTLIKPYVQQAERTSTITIGASKLPPFKFDNSYFKELKSKKNSNRPLDLKTDKFLIDDAKFWHYVELYAEDEEAFFKDYAELHKKLSELGFRDSLLRTRLAKSVAVIAVTSTVLVLGYLYVARRKAASKRNYT